MEAKDLQETSIDFQCSARRYIPEDMTIHDCRYENLKYGNKLFHLPKQIERKQLIC
jgi:hypothetical protein